MSARLAVIALTLTASALLLAGCSPASGPAEGGNTPTPTTVASVTPTPAETVKEIALPPACENAYSSEFVATLSTQHLPLNDPTLTMESTRVDAARAMIDQSADTLHCTWGVASEVGVSTDILHIDPSAATELEAALTGAGFECSTVDVASGERRCTQEEEFTGELPGKAGEFHVFRDNVWISTAWLNLDMAGYADDMVKTIWAQK